MPTDRRLRAVRKLPTHPQVTVGARAKNPFRKHIGSGDLTFIAGENGHPLTKESFGNLFRKACREAGLLGRSAHGLRKAAATRAANAGATVAELEAIFGWSGGTMAALYTRAADRRRLAKGAMHKLANDQRTNATRT